MNNYWCNLLNKNAINGEHNTARPIALAAMMVLCISLSLFWYQFPKYLGFKKNSARIIQFSGVLCMLISIFIFTSLHDIIINVAATFGLIPLCGTFAGLYKKEWYRLFAFGIFNLLLVVLNNYVYYTKGLIIYLPVIQKISFASFLLWICIINLTLFQKSTAQLR